jgi:hypothetical protein
VEAKRGEEADDAVRHAAGGFGQGLMFGRIGVCEYVEATVDPFEYSSADEAGERLARYAEWC